MATVQGVLTMHLARILVLFPEHPPIPLTEALKDFVQGHARATQHL